MEIIIQTDGNARCVYGESIPICELGKAGIKRASHVEPNRDGNWTADLGPVGGPVLGPFSERSLALEAETSWLRDNWLSPDA